VRGRHPTGSGSGATGLALLYGSLPGERSGVFSKHDGDMSDLSAFHGPNAGYVLDLYERFTRDPGAVDPSWRSYFESFPPTAGRAPAGLALATGGIDPAVIVGAHELAESIRARGHTAAQLDPLGMPRSPDPALEPRAHGIDEAALGGLPAAVVGGPAGQRATSAAEAIALLSDIYSGTIGYEFDHVQDADERDWIREAIESGAYAGTLTKEEKQALLKRLSQVEGFEKYLHKTFFGQKRFSIEGTDTLVPLLDEIIGRAAEDGTGTVVIGMAHRGRLNVLAHVLGKPYEMIVSGFQGAGRTGTALAPDDFTGDVKYHMGWEGSHSRGGNDVRVRLAPNPSHLEFVDPVVIGLTRAYQDETTSPGAPALNFARALPILVHGDAAFPGQGVVAETLNMSRLPGYSVGGSIHVIVNNQVGFTTNPSDARSTRYASDLAKGFEVPIVHVNADDVEACLSVARLAQAYRARFGKDFLIDLIGYRRWGHNEGDEPLFTQPRMYEVIRSHPTARERWAALLVEEGTVSAEVADSLLQEVYDRLDEAKNPPASTPRSADGADAWGGRTRAPETGVPADRLLELNEALLTWPEGFAPNPRLAKTLERRREAMGPEGGIDWGHAETLAFATLLVEGTPVRLTGQDVQRGTFSHRHQVLHHAETGATFTPLAALPGARASFEIYNSPLSEMAVVGFDYGYSVADPEVLVVWEAQFGDFANGAQVIIDQFMTAAQVKWEQTSGLVLLLPHGYEGQGPEHSSARLERFLQLAAQGNLRIANCTTSAQYFHLLRRQAALLGAEARPLIVMSPKSLLRHPMAASRLEQLESGRFHPVLGDESAGDRTAEITRLLLCSGKVHVDLLASEEREAAAHVALARVEELYPFPAEEIREQMNAYPNLAEVVWVQEEPKNMGAWSFVEPRLRELAGTEVRLGYEGRPPRASPAEGYAERHAAEQARIVTAAWQGAEAPRRARAAKRA
jgi:2-oxoglutarate dehydrogenase E1 component